MTQLPWRLLTKKKMEPTVTEKYGNRGDAAGVWTINNTDVLVEAVNSVSVLIY